MACSTVTSALIFVAIVLAILALMYATGFWSTKKKNVKVDVFLLGADWCGNCRNFDPEWQKFQEAKSSLAGHGYEITAHKIDCSKDSKIAQNPIYNHIVPGSGNSEPRPVTGFPTVIAKTEGKPAIDIRPTNTEGADQLLTNIRNMF